MKRKLYKNMLNNDSGITLTELLIYLVITAFLSLGISRLITDSAAGLDRASQESIAARQVIRFSSTIKYDISGSTDVKVFGTSILTTDLVCQSTSFNRPLFTVLIKALNPLLLPQVNGMNAYEPSPEIFWATYGLYQNANVDDNKLFLRRALCSKNAVINSENLLELGSSENFSTFAGTDFLAVSPMKTYTFRLPISLKLFSLDKGFSTYRNLTPTGTIDLLQKMTSKLDEVN